MRGISGPVTNASRRLHVAAMGALLICLLALTVVTSLSTYRSVRVQVDRELDERLLSMGQTIAQNLASAGQTTPQSLATTDPTTAPDVASPDPTVSKRLASDGSAAPTTADSVLGFQITRADLLRIAAASDLSSIEVIDARRRHLVGTDERRSFGERNPLLTAQPEVAIALAGIPVTTALYETPELRGTFFKTGFVPIEDAAGEVTGVVAVEGGSGFFAILPELRRIWWMAGLASATIASVLALLLLGLFRTLARSERDLRATTALATAGQLAAVVAHEIRNPLAALQSRAERAQEDLRAGGDPQRVAELLDAIPLEVHRLNRIVTNYLSLARGAEGDGTCSVLSVVEETLDLMAKDLERGRVAVALAAADRDLRARIGPGQLRQALLNLFLNAREAMEDGGELRVRVRADTSWAAIEVEDTGRGIDPHVRRQIFEPFFTTRPAGSGLGLAVVRSIVRSHHGRVDVRSEPGRGATFIILLPRDQKGVADAGPGGAV